jgi:hypothetical protein
MAEFVKKGSKSPTVERGIVGKLTKAEETGMVPVESLGVGSKIPDALEQITEEIKSSHKVALGQMGRAVLAAARAGELLAAAKAKLAKLPGKKPFTVWLAETFEFSQRTAYDYMTVHTKLLSRGGEIEGVTSIRDVLKLTDTTDTTTKKKKKDPKRESFVTWAAKIERYFADEIAVSPLEDWDPARRANCKEMLDGIARIHAEL